MILRSFRKLGNTQIITTQSGLEDRTAASFHWAEQPKLARMAAFCCRAHTVKHRIWLYYWRYRPLLNTKSVNGPLSKKQSEQLKHIIFSFFIMDTRMVHASVSDTMCKCLSFHCTFVNSCDARKGLWRQCGNLLLLLRIPRNIITYTT